MGSIPLPALHVQPPEDPTVGLQRAIQLKSLLNQQALMPGQLQQQQQQIQATGLENQQRAQQLKDQQAQTAAMQEWDGKSIDDLPGLVLKHGASATAVMGLKTGIIKQKQDLANLDKDQLANEAARSDQLLGHLDAIKGETDPAKRAQVASSQANQILSSGLVKDPQTTQMVQAIASGQYVPDDGHIDLMEKGLRSHSALIADAEKQATTAKVAAEGQKAQLEADFMKKYGGMTPQMMETRYVALQANKARGQQLSADDSAFLKGYEAQKKIVPVANFNLQNAGATAPAPGGGPSPIAQAIADGSMKWSDAVSPRTPMSVKTAMLAEVKKINPNFNSGDFQIEQQVKKAFTTGKPAEELVAFNTAKAHADLLQQAANALNNGDVRALNTAGNALGVQFGSDKATNFKVISDAYTREVNKALTAGHVTDSEIKEIGSTIPANASPSQISGALNAYRNLMTSKIQQRQQQYQQGVKAQPNFGQNNQGAMVTMRAPNGQTKQVRPEEVEHYKSMGASVVNQ